MSAADFREGDDVTEQPPRNAKDCAAGVAVIINQKPVAQNRPINDRILRNFPEKREIQRIGHGSCGEHLTLLNQAGIKTVHDQLGTGQLLFFNDLGGAFSNPPISQISVAYQENGMNTFLRYNGMETITFDFDKYPISGFHGDLFRKQVLNGEYDNYTWFQVREDGAPMVGVSYTANLKHALYPEFGPLAWDWAKHFSRNQETGEIEYNLYVK